MEYTKALTKVNNTSEIKIICPLDSHNLNSYVYIEWMNGLVHVQNNTIVNEIQLNKLYKCSKNN